MKSRTTCACLWALLLGTSLARPASGQQEVHLRGIVSFSTNQIAILEGPGNSPPAERILSPGQRDGDLELLTIDAKSASVRIKHRGTPLEIGFPEELPAGAWVESDAAQGGAGDAGSLRLQRAHLRPVLAIYEVLAQRCVIAPPLPAVRLDLGCKGPARTSGLVQVIEKALAREGITVKPDGDKFMLLGKSGDSAQITPALKEVSTKLAETRAPGQSAGATAGDLLPAGVINFPGTDLEQVLMIYQELVNRTLLRSSQLPAQSLHFRNSVPLTMAETIYALTATLAINGISVVPAGEKFLFVCPAADAGRVEALASRQSPAQGASDTPSPGALNLQNIPVSKMVELYQQFSGKTVTIGPDLPQLTFTMRSQTALTTAEALQGLDLLLGLNGFEVLPAADTKALRVVRKQ